MPEWLDEDKALSAAIHDVAGMYVSRDVLFALKRAHAYLEKITTAGNLIVAEVMEESGCNGRHCDDCEGYGVEEGCVLDQWFDLLNRPEPPEVK